MRDYGRVFSAIWASEDFRALTEDGRALVLYLLTCQHGTLAGVFRLPDGYVAEDLQWSSERVAEGFRNVASKGFATRCEATKWVWISKYLEWNPLENPNQRKAAAKLAEKVPAECQWRQDFRRASGPSIGLAPEPLPNPSATVPQPVLGTGTGEGAGENTHTPLAPEWVLPKAWGEWATAEYPHWSPDTVRSIAEQFADHQWSKAATCADWQAAWRKWCRDDLTQRAHPAPKPKAADKPQPGAPAITVPSTDKGAERFNAAMDERKATATKPPADVLALRSRRVAS